LNRASLNLIEQKWPTVFIAGSVVIAAVKYAPMAWRVVKQMYALARALEAVALLPERVDSLIKEVKPNGGSSLRDAIDSTARDISRLAYSIDELALRERTRWRMSTGAAGWESDHLGRFLRVNMEMCELLDCGEEDLTGTNWKNSVHSDDAQRVFSEWGRIINEGSDLSMSARLVDSNGITIPVRLKAHAMILGGRPIGWIGTAERE
jgi:PAS domain S-box-containing protein